MTFFVALHFQNPHMTYSTRNSTLPKKGNAVPWLTCSDRTWRDDDVDDDLLTGGLVSKMEVRGVWALSLVHLQIRTIGPWHGATAVNVPTITSLEVFTYRRYWQWLWQWCWLCGWGAAEEQRRSAATSMPQVPSSHHTHSHDYISVMKLYFISLFVIGMINSTIIFFSINVIRLLT